MKNKALVILSIIIICILSILLVDKTIDGDTYYVIKAGEWIKEYGLDFKDHASFLGNLSYTYPHFLFDVIVYLVYNSFGFNGIYIFTVIIFCIINSLIFLINYKSHGITASLITAIIFASCLSFFAVCRAQIITFIVFLLEIYFIEKYIEKKSKISLAMLFILPVIIANVHIGVFYLYYVLFLPFIAEYIIAVLIEKNILKMKFNSNIIIKKNNNVKYLIYLIIPIFLMGLFSFLGLNVYTYYPKAASGISMNYISEYNSISIKFFTSFFIILFIYIISILLFKKKIKLREVFLIIGLSIMTFYQQRCYALFLVCTASIFADTIKYFANKKNIKIALVSLILLVNFVNAYKFYDNTKVKSYISTYLYPVYACEYIKSNMDLESVRFYNDYDYGSYLLFKDIPVFIDQRAELYTKEFNRGLGNFFHEAMRSELYIEELIDKYKLTHFLLHKNSILNIIIRGKEMYNEIYNDGVFLIYEIK